jgi:hypothetical protein
LISRGSAELSVIANGISSQVVPVTVLEPHMPTINEDMINSMIELLADNKQLRVLTHHGQLPIDRDASPNHIRSVKKAQNDIRHSIKTLQTIGRQIETKRITAAKKTKKAKTKKELSISPSESGRRK